MQKCNFCELLHKGIKVQFPELLDGNLNHVLCKCTHSRRELVGKDDSSDSLKGMLYIVLDSPDGRCNLMINRLEGELSHLLTRRIVHAEKVELTLVRQWMHVCEEYHPGCKSNWESVTTPAFQLRCLNVETDCIEAAPKGINYVALSYVWGQNNILRASRDNIVDLSQPGAFREYKIPKTVRDAMLVTRKIGYTYLWVDVLCIVQDDDADKATQVQNMNLVYGWSDLTIVAADSKDAHAGLSGTSSDSRNGKQQTMTMAAPRNGEISLVVTWPAFDDKQRAKSIWASRGWTFQEGLLSQRLLIFYKGRMTWECRGAVWTKDVSPGCIYGLHSPSYLQGEAPLVGDRLASTLDAVAHKGQKLNAETRDDELQKYDHFTSYQALAKGYIC